MNAYRVDWCAGPSAEIELFRPKGSPSEAGLSFRYNPPFRATLRPPIEVIPITANDLEPASQSLRGLAGSVSGRARDVSILGAGRQQIKEATDAEMQSLGGLLYDLVMSDAARNDLRHGDCFVDFGVEEAMLHFPWELMHDGEEYVCLKHSFGRFVSGAMSSAGQGNPKSWLGEGLARISVLLIAVPQPQERRGSAAGYPHLAAAELEMQAVVEALSAIEHVDVTVLAGANATTAAVANALRTGRFQIVHYCGHASYDSNQPTNSALILWDGDLTAGVVQRLFIRARPVLCVVNACESARLPDEGALNVYSLARAFLDTGTYLVGSRWKLDDVAASSFAAAFYASLLGRGEPLGHAVRAGRISARHIAVDRFAWGAYVLYGDPRLCFRRLPSAEPLTAHRAAVTAG